jgi:hypothetical protein
LDGNPALYQHDGFKPGSTRRTAYVIALILFAFIAACDNSSNGIAAVSATQSPNPLATNDQELLDGRLAAFSSAHPFSAEREFVRMSYLDGYGETPSDEAISRLDIAVDELVHGAMAVSLNSNGQRPRVHWLGAGTRDWFGVNVPGSRWAFDNPDNAYRTIPIDPAGAYVIRGQRTGDGPADMTFSLINDPVTQGTEAFLDGKALVVGEDGSYSITVDGEPAGQRVNHIQTTAAAQLLFIRSNLGDWANEEHDELHVEYLGEAAEELSDEEVAARTTAFLHKAGPIYGLALLGAKTRGQPANTFPAPSAVSTPGALVSQANSFGHFRIRDDECLLVTLDPGGAGYFIVPVTDPWMVGVDPSRQTSLNQSQAVADVDGRYTFVVSLQDPGVHNWVDAAGLHEGTMMIRWQRLPAGGGTPALEVQLLNLSELDAALPAGTLMLNAAEREEQLSARRADYLRRFEES